jgi:hypothetical protein
MFSKTFSSRLTVPQLAPQICRLFQSTQSFSSKKLGIGEASTVLISKISQISQLVFSD